ncbi:MAG: GIY-YIG nuclease family protein [Candidatus Lokiarchaeota archaeon]|nr:GIY-YIG nuclease family protein [Candidatus Lokiarchaeota archaeon]
MSVFYVYILETTTKNGKTKFYTGYTNDLLRRLKEHKNNRGAKFCKGKDIEIKYFESYMDIKEAMKRELEIKSFTREKKLDLIKNFSKG